MYTPFLFYFLARGDNMKITVRDELHGFLLALCAEAFDKAGADGAIDVYLENAMGEAAKEISSQAALTVEEKNSWKEEVERQAYLAEMTRAATAEEHLDELRLAVQRVMAADAALELNAPAFEHALFGSDERKNQDEWKAAWQALGALVRK
jgi:hypothetical protein